MSISFKGLKLAHKLLTSLSKSELYEKTENNLSSDFKSKQIDEDKSFVRVNKMTIFPKLKLLRRKKKQKVKVHLTTRLGSSYWSPMFLFRDELHIDQRNRNSLLFLSLISSSETSWMKLPNQWVILDQE